jgi:hypothetical protein
MAKKKSKKTYSSKKKAQSAINKKGDKVYNKTQAANKVVAASGKKASDIKIKRIGEPGSGNMGVRLRWHPSQPEAQIKEFNIDIEWFSASLEEWIQLSNTTTAGQKDSVAEGWYMYTFDAENDTDVAQIRARVKPISENHSVKYTYYEPKRVKQGKKHVYKNVKKTGSKDVAWFKDPGYTGWAVLSPAPALEDAPEAPTRISATVPNRPAEPTAELQSNGDIEVKFEEIDATKAGNERRVYRCMDGDYESSGDDVSGAITANGAERFVDTTATPGHEYRYYIRAYNNRATPPLADEPPSLPTDLCKPIATEPVDIENLTAECFGTDSARVSFDYPDGFYYKALESVKVYYADSLEVLVTNKTSNSSVDVTLGFQEMSVIVSGLETGKTWYFAPWLATGSDDQLELFSEFTASCTIATTPDPPTMMDLPKAAYIGSEVDVVWTHNNADGSAQTAAEILVIATKGGESTSLTYTATSDERISIPISSEVFQDSSTFSVKVRTKGAADSWSEWSEDVAMTVYAKPSALLSLRDATQDGPYGKRVVSLPAVFDLSVSASSGALSQSVIQWRLVLRAKEAIDYVDSYGNDAVLSAGEIVADVSVDSDDDDFTQPNQVLEVTALDAVFMDGAAYDATVYALMDSGLESDPFTMSFDCAIESGMNAPTASIMEMYDWSVRIYPALYAYSNDDPPVETMPDNVLLSVYRIGNDGTLNLIADEIKNTGTFVTDRHPAFGEMRYRVVANNQDTDEVTVYDITEENDWNFILIQWNEKAGVTNQDYEDLQFAFEYVRLPWNTNVKHSSAKDVAYKKYQGRTHPIALYGTQVGETGSWTADIIKFEEDQELYQLRKLQAWMGECWVRDASGLSYPANVDVSISREWDSLAISVSLEVTRVDGD